MKSIKRGVGNWTVLLKRFIDDNLSHRLGSNTESVMNNTDLLNIASIYKKTLQMLASYRLNTNDSNQQPFYISFRTI